MATNNATEMERIQISSDLKEASAPLAKIFPCFPHIKSLYQQLHILEHDAKRLFATPNSDQTIELLSASALRLLKRVLHAPNVLISIYGSNSSGKSTLLNSLLGVSCMPSGIGHVTGRVCVLEYCHPVDARIEFVPIDQYQLKRTDDQVKYPNITPTKLMEILHHELDRNFAPSPTEQPQEFAQWSNTVVKVFYPFPLLQSGLVIADLPGKSKTDFEVQQLLISSFFQHAKPAGVLMLYSNETFSDAEVAAYDFLLKSLPTQDPEQLPSIFLGSTFFDAATLIYDYNSDELTDDMVYESIRIRYNLLVERKLPVLDLPPELENATTFGCVNALEYLNLSNGSISNTDESIRRVFTRFTNVLFQWIVSLQRRRYLAALSKIKSAVMNFFQFYFAATEEGRFQHINQELSRANESLSKTQAAIMKDMYSIWHDIPNQVKSIVEDKRFVQNAIDIGANMSVGVYEGVSMVKDKDLEHEARGAFQQLFAPFIISNVWNPVLENCRIRIMMNIMQHISNLENSAVTNQNQTLVSTLRSITLSEDTLKFTTPASSLCMGVKATWGKVLGNWASSWSKRRSSIDSQWKEDTVRKTLTNLKADIDETEFFEPVKAYVRDYFSSITEELTAVQSRATYSNEAASRIKSLDPKQLSSIISDFRALILDSACTSVLLSQAPLDLVFQNDKEVAFFGLAWATFHGTLNNEPVFIKVSNGSPDFKTRVAQEFHWTTSSNSACYAIWDSNDQVQLVYPSPSGFTSLHELLKSSFTLPECLQIAMELAQLIESAHKSSGFIFCSIQPTDVWIQFTYEEKTQHIDVKVLPLGHLALETPFRCPEFNTGLFSAASDTACFGYLMSMVGSVCGGLQSSPNLPIWDDLMNRCQHPDPTQRPELSSIPIILQSFK